VPVTCRQVRAVRPNLGKMEVVSEANAFCGAHASGGRRPRQARGTKVVRPERPNAFWLSAEARAARSLEVIHRWWRTTTGKSYRVSIGLRHQKRVSLTGQAPPKAREGRHQKRVDGCQSFQVGLTPLGKAWSAIVADELQETALHRRQTRIERHTGLVELKSGTSVLSMHLGQDGAEVLFESSEAAISKAELLLK
jgi:hypothetical protein